MTTVAITTIHSVFIRGLLSRATGPVGADLPTFRIERTSTAAAMQMHYRPLGRSEARRAAQTGMGTRPPGAGAAPSSFCVTGAGAVGFGGSGLTGGLFATSWPVTRLMIA